MVLTGKVTCIAFVIQTLLHCLAVVPDNYTALIWVFTSLMIIVMDTQSNKRFYKDRLDDFDVKKVSFEVGWNFLYFLFHTPPNYQ